MSFELKTYQRDVANFRDIRSTPTPIGTSNAAHQRVNERLREQGPQTPLVGPASPLDGMLMQLSMHRNWYWHQKAVNHSGMYVGNQRPWPPRAISALVGWTVQMLAQGRV